VEVPVGNRRVRLEAWRADVGRVPVYLLDADVYGNTHEDRRLTARLYDGDGRHRLLQEVVLGLGGMALLRALGQPPDVLHLNEGHCALAVLDLMAASGVADFASALAAARPRVVFTTHTPVPAGHDRFGADDVRDVLGGWLGQRGWTVEQAMDLGRVRPGDASETMCMTVIALRGSRAANGVAALHGVTSRAMWRDLFPDRPDVPIGHVTNGVHPHAWIAPPVRALLDATCPGWREKPWDPSVWDGLDGGAALREAREACRRRLRDEVERRCGVRIPPDRLVLGFARRFAPYKRADLLLSDPDRLRPLLDEAVVVYAGKAHPRDANGKDILARVAAHARRRDLRGRVLLLEDYDLTLGAVLTSGCDAWVNTPRRPQEASGTSGQKAALNGVPNVSVLDGWWPEGFDGTNGWAIGDGTDGAGADPDAADRDALYAVLADRVLPTWRDRAAWLTVAARSIRTAGPRFTSHRMVRDYARDVYAAD
jgi:alpha-glucan phosphorylase-like protein